MLNNGTAKYGIGLKVPPGIAGQYPTIHLSYEGGGGNGSVGYGWQLSQTGVQRQCDKGIPTYGESLGVDRPDRFLNDSKEELVPRGDGYSFCKNEGSFTRYQFIDGHWEATLPDGTLLFFGTVANSRIQDGNNSAKIFNWLLDREVDTRGNTITYSYTNFPGARDLNQRYLSEVRYGPGRPTWDSFHFVKFHYEERRDWFEDCRPGFPVRTGHRLHSVDVGTQGQLLAGHLHGDFNGDGAPDSLVRRYDLGYWEQAGPPTHGSLLHRITQIGADGVSTLPPLTLGYSVCAPPDRISATQSEIGSAQEPPLVMDNPLVELADLNGDGLPDLLETGGPTHLVYLNQGASTDSLHSQLAWGSSVEVDAASGDAWLYSLSSSATHLADMDGDGRADLVHRRGDATVLYFSNLGTNAWAERREMSEGPERPPAPFGEANVRTGDFDFDKRTDLIRGDGLEYTLWFNLGDNRYSDAVTVPQDFPFDLANPAVQIADLNGDRVPDIARVGPVGLELTVGVGYGHFSPLLTIPIPDLSLTDEQIRRAKLSDITGDGLADLVLERADGGELWYWINLGNASFTSRKVIVDMPASLGLNTVTRWADMNGNGTTDLVYADPDAAPKLRTFDLGTLLNCGTTPNLLTAISNGIGRVTLIGYAPSTQFLLEDRAQGITWTNGMPFPVTVISSITNLDSLGHSYVSRFRYHDGYYDPVEKQFRGFSRVEQIDVGDDSAPTEVTRSVFDTGRVFEAMKGRVLQLSTETVDGRVFQTESTAWITPPKLLLTGTNGLEVRYAHPVASTRRVLELGQGAERRLESEMRYDDFGNQTRHADYGIVENGDRSAFDDERITLRQYAINTNAWILRAVAVQELRDEHDAVISRSEQFYDDETFSGRNLGFVTIGNLTLKRDWVSPSDSTATVLSSRTQYDTYGNPIILLDPLAVAPGGVPDAGRGHWRRIDYDSRFHAYPIAETIELGSGKDPLVLSAAYDEGFGTVTSSTDFNGNTTRYGYDTFSRLTRLLKPGDTDEFSTVEYDYALGVPVGEIGQVNYVETRQLDKAPSEPGTHRAHYFISRTFVDGLGRKLITKKEAEPAPGSTAPRVVVTEAVQFNARQKSVRALNPYFSLVGSSLDDLLAFENIEAPGWQGQFHNEGGLVTLDLAAAHASRTDYDATLRPTQVTNPDGTQRRTVYEPLLTRSLDENDTDPASAFFDTPMVHSNDGLGRLIQVDETSRLNDDGTPAGSGAATPVVWTTRYKYDLNDQLTRITDSQNNVKTFAYDGLKRKTDMNDPDRGVMHFVYDDASNLTETTDAKAQRITYAYDGANRIRTETYHDGLPLPSWRSSRGDEALTNSVIYHYDTPVANLPQGDNTLATARNMKGALAWVEDLSGEEHTSYDSRGRVEWVAKRIPDPLVPPHSSLVTYRTTFAYDSLDRLTNLTYPDADQLRYEYNDRKLLQRIPGGFTGGEAQLGNIIANLLYLPSGQMAQIDYGNGVRTSYAYDSRLRLNSLITAPAAAPASPLIAFGYTFDAVSNIKLIEDQRPGSVVPEGDKRRNTQIFSYDDLYRLTQARYSFELPGQAKRNDGEINYRYDRIGNMLAQTSTLVHEEKGLPVANLGEMDSGGASGRIGRIGRAADEPPGPHALTAIRNPQSAIRNYSYDANGNMTVIDGLTNNWDFKDRLVVVESAEMRAEYTYDYTDRRITKRVAWKPGYPLPSDGRGAGGEGVTTTLYIDRFFEVRDYDAPTKYVWNGSTRVARVTGNLSATPRIQRIRVRPGWNLLSLAVGGASVPVGASGVNAAARWNQPGQNWLAISPSDLLPAGTVLWLNAATNAVLAFTGTYLEPTNRVLVAGASFQPGAGLEPLELHSGLSPPSVAWWRFDSVSNDWLNWLPGEFQVLSNNPSVLPPGEGFFAKAHSSGQVNPSDWSLKIRYYHQDHLGSSSVMTDVSGVLVEETSNYAFGQARHESRLRGRAENYQFIQKERDRETGLHYLEARFVATSVARFTRIDPLSSDLPAAGLLDPQLQNPYSYARNAPLIYKDPSGEWIETAWDIASLTISISEFANDPSLLNAVAVVADTAAVALPLVPGGAGATIKAAKLADKGIEAASNLRKAAIRGKDLNETINLRGMVETAEKASVATKRDGAVLWSGGKGRQAADFARKEGKMTLEMTEGGRKLALEQKRIGVMNDTTRKAWDTASGRFARGAEGKVDTFVKGAGESSTFKRVEQPILKESAASGKVTDISPKD